MTRTFSAAAALAGAAVLLGGAPAHAAGPPVLFAVNLRSYWTGFADFWTGSLQRQNNVVLFALGIGALGIAIIVSARRK